MEGKLGKFVNKEINEHCGSCASACCGPNVFLELSTKEGDFLRSSGTILTIQPNQYFNKNTNKNFYLLESKCGFVINENGLYKCDAYNNPQRPVICSEVEAGGEICKKIKDSRKTGIGYEFGY